MASDRLQAFADGLAALGLERDTLLIEPAEGEPLTVPVADLLYMTTAKRGVRIALIGGREILTRPSETLQGFSQRLAKHPNVVRTQNTYLVNLDQVDKVGRLDSDNHRLTFYDGRTAPVTMAQGKVMAYFGIQNLDHVTPWNDRLATIIDEKLRMFEQDIRFMEDDEIRAHFSTKTTGELVTREIIGNIIWQAYNWIQAGKLAPIDGNIRSFWYSHIKPVLGRFFRLNENQYDALTNVLTEYVGIHHLFRYADLGFVDDSGAQRAVGPQLPHIIFCVEKQGHLRIAQRVGAATGVTTIALGGQPSLMTTEGLAEELARVTTLDQTFHLVTDVDYDPSGNIIADSFRRQLRSMGLKEVTRFDIIQPVNFTDIELKRLRYAVANESPSDQEKTRLWMDKKITPFGGGLPGDDGQPVPYGMESDAMDKQRLHDLAVTAIQQLAATPPGEAWPEVLARVRQHRPPIVGLPYP